MKKLLVILLATMMLAVSCDMNVGGNNPIPDDPGTVDPTPTAESIDILNRGDFEDFTVDASVSNFNWGASNGTVVESDGNKVVRIEAADAQQELYYNNFYPFYSSDATLSARIKLNDVADAESVTLKFEVLSDKTTDNLIKDYSAQAEAITDWQTVSVEIPAAEYDQYAYSSTVKVVVAAGVESVLVDDVKLVVKDETAVNWLPYGDFESSNTEDSRYKDSGEYWKIIPTAGEWKALTGTDGGDGDKYIDLETGEILIGRTLAASGDINSELYPTAQIDYPDTRNGVVTLVVQGEEGQTIDFEIKSKNPGAEVQAYSNGPVTLQDNSKTEITLQLSSRIDEARETEVQVKNNSGKTLKIYDIRLNLASTEI